MKVKILLSVILLSAWNCSDETHAPSTPIDDMISMTAVLKQSGTFMKGPYGTVTGMAQIYKNTDGTFAAKLSDFNTANGPDLYVYLSKEIMPVNFISLGKLKSTNGNQVYAISGGPDFSDYKYVCIHCKEYNHLFGYAALQ